MSKKTRVLRTLGIVMTMIFCISGCGNRGNSIADTSVPGQEGTTSAEENVSDMQTTDNQAMDNHTVKIDLKPSQGFEFESNGDGTCTIVGIGNCTDKDIVIPEKSPNGDTVTLIGNSSFYALEDVNSIKFINYNYEVGKNAFQFSEITSLNIIGGGLTIKKSAFSSCEDLISLSFEGSTIKTEEYTFYNCGKSAAVEMNNCSLAFEDRAFQYSSFESLTISGSKIEMGDSVFSNCEDLIAVYIASELLVLGEYSFYNCDDLRSVTICNFSTSGNQIKIDDRSFEYCKRLETVTIEKGDIEIGKYVFA